MSMFVRVSVIVAMAVILLSFFDCASWKEELVCVYVSINKKVFVNRMDRISCIYMYVFFVIALNVLFNINMLNSRVVHTIIGYTYKMMTTLILPEHSPQGFDVSYLFKHWLLKAV